MVLVRERALFQFLLLRWYFRLLIWARFLWQVSSIDMNLVPTHPDRVGGLGFLSGTAYAFIPLAVAHGAVLCGMIANRILHAGTALMDFKVEIAMVVVFVLCLVIVPLLLFAPQLARAKRDGLREYGTLAQRYVRSFDAKWNNRGEPPGEALLGSADVQSLADLANSFEVVRTMRIVLVTRDTFIQLATRHAPSADAAPADDDAPRRIAEKAVRDPVLRAPHESLGDRAAIGGAPRRSAR